MKKINKKRKKKKKMRKKKKRRKRKKRKKNRKMIQSINESFISNLLEFCCKIKFLECDSINR